MHAPTDGKLGRDTTSDRPVPPEGTPLTTRRERRDGGARDAGPGEGEARFPSRLALAGRGRALCATSPRRDRLVPRHAVQRHGCTRWRRDAISWPANWHPGRPVGRHALACPACRRVALSHCITNDGRSRAEKTAPDPPWTSRPPSACGALAPLRAGARNVACPVGHSVSRHHMKVDFQQVGQL
jgi:hypothetical protein